ncbi:MAG: S-layer homology domain-containing protein, partial [Candidatus Enterenecus sp.]
MVTASATAYSDDADISYKEAVEVLTAAGVFTGVGNGEFLPNSVLNREAAAKLIAYAVEGHDLTAATVDAIDNPFTDVNNWAEPYVKYCASKGIIVGVGDGKFLPKSALNGYAFGKMLLIATGLCTPDQFTGSDWKLNVATALKDNGLLAGGMENQVLSANLTREQAAQMIFNSLFKSASGSTVYVLVFEDGEVEFDNLQDALLYKAAVGGELAVRRPTTGTLAAKLGVACEDYVNESGLKVHVWTVNDKVVTDEFVDDAYVTTYATGTSYATIAKDLGVVEKNNKVTAKWFANGEQKETFSAAETVDFLKSTAKTEAPVAVYADGANSYKLMATIEYLATVTAVSDKADANGKYTFTFEVENGYSEDVVAAKDTYVKGGTYLVVPQGDDTTPNGFLSCVEAESVTVTVTGKGTGYVKAGTATYYAAPGRTPFAGVTLGTEWVLWLSSEGTVIAVARPAETPVETPEVLVYVTAFYSIKTPEVPAEKDKYGNDIPNTGSPETTTIYAQGVDMDGNEVTYVVGEKNEALVGTIAAVEYNKTTKVNDLVTAESATKLTLVANKISVDGYYYNTASYISVAGSLDKLVVATGNLKGAVAANPVWVVFTTIKDSTNKTVTKVFYPETPIEVETEYDTAILAFAGSAVESNIMVQKDKDGKDVNVTVYTHNVYLNGKPISILTYDEAIEDGMFKYAVDEYGVYELVALEDGVYNDTVKNVYGSYVTTNEVTDYDMSNVTLVDLRKGDDADGKLEIGDSILYYAVDSNRDGVIDIDLIYIVPAAEAEV